MQRSELRVGDVVEHEYSRAHKLRDWCIVFAVKGSFIYVKPFGSNPNRISGPMMASETWHVPPLELLAYQGNSDS